MCLSVPGRIISITGDNSLTRTGRVDFGGVMQEVSLAYVPTAAPGDYVIVHVGVALNILDEADAMETLALLEELRRAEPAPPPE
ncbi:HypC/HybG/HupF family hydrogenase formation chaperone [bacterium]|nr:HypC/HybG/HupF family hydrogenase formation chaperone [candidate division CSSED10-310 bacterium]